MVRSSSSSSSSGVLRRRLSATLNNAAVLSHHLHNAEDAQFRYVESLRVRDDLALSDDDGYGCDQSEHDEIETELHARCEETRREVSDLNRQYKRSRRDEAPRLDLYPTSVLESSSDSSTDATSPTSSSSSTAQDEGEEHAPLLPLLIPSSDESLETEDLRSSATTLYNMGLLHRGQGEIEAATASLDAALTKLTEDGSIRKDLFLRSVILNARALIEYEQGELQSSMDHCQEALKCHQTLTRQADDDADEQQDKYEGHTASMLLTRESVIADAFSLMGRIHFVVGNADESYEFTTEALHLRRKTAHVDAHSFAASVWNVGMVRGALKADPWSAIDHLEEFICLAGEANSSFTASCLRQIAGAHYAIGCLHLETESVTSAVGSFRSALNLRNHSFGPDHPVVASSYYKLATVLHAASRRSTAAAATGTTSLSRMDREALDLCGEALRIHRSNFGDESTQVGRVLSLMGTIHQDSGRVDLALALYEEALEAARSKLVGEQDDNAFAFVADMLESIGHLRLYGGESGVAIANFADSTRIRSRLQQQEGAPVVDDGSVVSSSRSLKTTKELMESFSAAAAA